MFQTVLVGADDSETARQAVKVAAEIAGIHGGQLHVVTAFEAKQVSMSGVPAEFRNNAGADFGPADALLADLTAMIKQFGLEPVVHAAKGDPEDAIVRVAEREGADLIVVGNKGMKGRRRLLGSVPNSVAHNAPCSVLIVDTEASS
jgi:nucleotide-binding universal stress UspA family protein